MNTDSDKRFLFGDSCLFDMDSNTIVDLQDGRAVRYTPVSATEGAVLRQLVQAYPDAVTKEQLCGVINAECDNSDVRRIINKLKNRHPLLKLWIPRGREGEYRLREPVLAQKEHHATQPPRMDESCTLKSTGICVRPNFVMDARLDIFDGLDEAFDESHVVFLQGIGGIGKSEAAKHWALRRKKEGLFDTVVFAQLNAETENSNVQSLITDDAIFVISGPFRPRDEEESTDSYFHRKLAKIKQLTDERTLIVIDNYDIDDPLLAALFTGPYRLLVTTRNQQTGYDFPLIPVTEIQEPEHLRMIFFKNLGAERDDIAPDDPYIEKLFGLVSNHTLTIEIIGKSLVNSMETPESLYRKMSDPERHALLRHMDGLVDRNFSEEPLTPFECIRRLFNLSRLERDRDYEYKSQVLVFLAAMPTRGIELSLFKKWSDSRIIRAKNSLVQKSWLRQDTVKGVALISMHPLISEIVWRELEPTLEKCGVIIERITQDDYLQTDWLYHQPRKTKDQYERIAVSLLTAFPVCDLRGFDFYITIQRIFHTCTFFNSTYSIFALELPCKMKAILEQHNQTSTWLYGYLNYRIGIVYSWIFRDCRKGTPYLLNGNKQMAACAQTNEEKMWLAFSYREIACLNCRDEYLFDTHIPYSSSQIEQIEQSLDCGEVLISELKKDGYRKSNLDIYHGTVCVWRSKIAIFRGNLTLATSLIDEAESEFIRFGYPNVMDKAAVADVRARICAMQGEYDKEVKFLKEAVRVFESGHSKYHRASIERSIRLATAYQNNHQPGEAIKLLTHYRKIAEEMLSIDAAFSVTIREKLNQLLDPDRQTEV